MKKQGARLGQHFLTNSYYAQQLVDCVGAKEGVIALEIGPGGGALTKVLLKNGAFVVAIEKDELLAQKLHTTFSAEIASKHLRVVEGDVRDFAIAKTGLKSGEYVLAANIPYYITGEIIRQFLETDVQPSAMALLIQKEVADRIISEKESILSLSVKVYGTPKIVARVSKGNFNPPPSVDSAIILISEISKKNFSSVSEKDFFEVVRTGFASKRKQLAGNLSKKFGGEKVAAAFKKLHIDSKVRAEDVHTDQWLQIAENLSMTGVELLKTDAVLGAQEK